MKKPFVIPHSKQDCVDLRLKGKHVAYACYYHAASVASEIAEGNDDVPVEQWGIAKAHDGKVKCCQGE